MINGFNKHISFSITIFACCASLCLAAVYYILSNRSLTEYLCHSTIQKPLNGKYSEYILPNIYDKMSNSSMIGRRSTLTLHHFLNAKHPELVSPNRRFILRLESTGNLRYLEVLEFQRMVDFQNNKTLSKAQLFEKSLFSTSTGDSWPGEHVVDLTPTGVLQIRVKPTFMNEWKTTWASSLLPQCKKSSLTNSTPLLSVQDSGMLAIYSRQDSSDILCILHPEVIYQSDISPDLITTNSKGKNPRLALVIAGFFRTNTIACRSHVDKIINKWQQKYNRSVDVFIFTYIQDAHLPGVSVINDQSITTALQACYKDNLKSVRVRGISEVQEAFLDINGSAIKQCGPKLHRLQSQLKTVYLAGQLMRNYMLSEGITYDYVLRLRPDTDFWGSTPDLPVFGVFDNEARLFFPHPYREHYYWCSHHDGRVRTGVTDQLAYGTLPAMQTYFNTYLEFSEIILIVAGHYTNVWKKAKYNTMRCEGIVGENGCDRLDVNHCTIECFVSYYLVLHGLEPENLWTWQQNLLRAVGVHSNECGQPFNC